MTQQDDRLNKFSRWLRELELKAWKSLSKAGHDVEDVMTYIAIDGVADLDDEEPDRSELEMWMKQSQIGAQAFSRPGQAGSAADTVQVLLTGEPIIHLLRFLARVLRPGCSSSQPSTLFKAPSFMFT